MRGVYNKAQHLPERARMMQHGADLLDGLADGEGKIVAERFRKSVANASLIDYNAIVPGVLHIVSKRR